MGNLAFLICSVSTTWLVDPEKENLLFYQDHDESFSSLKLGMWFFFVFISKSCNLNLTDNSLFGKKVSSFNFENVITALKRL